MFDVCPWLIVRRNKPQQDRRSKAAISISANGYCYKGNRKHTQEKCNRSNYIACASTFVCDESIVCYSEFVNKYLDWCREVDVYTQIYGHVRDVDLRMFLDLFVTAGTQRKKIREEESVE